MSNINTNTYTTTQQNIQNYQQTAQAVGEATTITAGEVVKIVEGAEDILKACTPFVTALGGLFSSCCKKADKTVKPEFETPNNPKEITQTKTTNQQIAMTSSKVESKPLSTRESVVVAEADKK